MRRQAIIWHVIKQKAPADAGNCKEEFIMKKKMVAAMMACTLGVTLLAGCGEDGSSDSKPKGGTQGGQETDSGDLSGTLTFAIWDNNLNDFIESNDMVGKFQEKYPDIEIEVEKIKDDSEYWNAMKMRASANQLPDVMFNKTFTLSRFKDYLLDLSDTEACKNNELAEGYAVDGKVLGIPMTSGYEYVYYWKDMFKEAGAEVPSTWPEFEDTAKKLQDYFGKDNADFMAIACGLKDEWPDYPYMEFMPALESGNGQNWNTMAGTDEPFTEESDIYKAYTKVNELFQSGVLGKDPLGLGNDQATALFASKNAAIIALGDWGLQNIQNNTEDISELGTFYLPTRNSASDPYNVVVQGDSFMGVTTHSENPEADNLCPDKVMVMYDGGGDDFTAIQNETTFDYKKLGAEMMTDGFDLKAKMDELNKKWKDARAKLGIQ